MCFLKWDWRQVSLQKTHNAASHTVWVWVASGPGPQHATGALSKRAIPGLRGVLAKPLPGKTIKWSDGDSHPRADPNLYYWTLVNSWKSLDRVSLEAGTRVIVFTTMATPSDRQPRLSTTWAAILPEFSTECDLKCYASLSVCFDLEHGKLDC